MLRSFGAVCAAGLVICPVAAGGGVSRAVALDDVVLTLPEGDGNDLAVLEDDGNPSNGMSRLRSRNNRFAPIVFANPSGSLTIDFGDDGENVLVAGVDTSTPAFPIRLVGGAGNDRIALANRVNTRGGAVDDGGGIDALDYSAWAVGVTVDLGRGTATGTGGIGGIESVTGGGGDDRVALSVAPFSPLLGRMDGGPGTDRLDYSQSTAQISVNLGTGTARGTRGVSGFENVRGGSAPDSLTGDDGPNRLEGRGGKDLLDGAGGDDVLQGGLAPDDLHGGAGSDTVDFSDLSCGIDIYLEPGANTLTDPMPGCTTVSTDKIWGDVENAIGTPYSDGLHDWGVLPVARLEGGGGDDVFDWLGAERVVEIGGPGDDKLVGSYDDDVLDGGPGNDSVRWVYVSGPLTIDLTAGTATGTGNDTLSSLENVTASSYSDTIVGTSGPNTIGGGGDDDQISGLGSNDVIDGGPGNDTISGGDGDDHVSGGDGNDRLQLGPGDDVYDGGAGTDSAVFSDALGPVTASLAGGTASGEGSDTLTGIENLVGSPFGDSLTGDDGPNLIRGGDGNDHLFGLGSGDHLYGEGGDDDIDGGAGTDTCDQGPGSGTIVNCP